MKYPRLIACLMMAGMCMLKVSFAQEEAPKDSLPPAPIEKVIEGVKNVQINRFGLDKKINDGFAPFGNGVADIIFYAPKIGEDVLYGEKGQSKLADDFYDNPPFTIEYEEGDLPTGTQFEVSGAGNNQVTISYPRTETLPLGEAFTLKNGQTILVTHDPAGYNSETDEAAFKVTLTEYEKNYAQGVEIARLDEFIEQVVQSSFDAYTFATLPIEKEASLDNMSQVLIKYTRTVKVPLNEAADIDGNTLTVKPNANSAYPLEDRTYTFSVSTVKFLPIVIIILILGATYFTIYFKFVNFTKFKLAIDVVRGKYTDPTESGEVSHFQALTAALSGTVGLGNIAGVAIAISIGGAGATFWMILAGLIGMSSKFVECTLGVKYRHVNEKGVVSGGPMYYLSEGLAERGMATLGKVFAGFFAVMCIGGSFGGGNMFQVNQAFKQFKNVTGGAESFAAGYGWLFGVVMAVLVAIVIIGGIRSIAKVTDKIVPFMCGIYVLAAVVIIGMNLGEVPRTLGEIFSGAFAPQAIAGGFVGVLIQGFRRAAFSNEAGVGSASIAHAAVKTNNPASEGIVALLEPFIDTVVVCTMTALVIIITNNHLDPAASDGVALTSRAFSSEIPFFRYILSIAVILFAFSTMITWSYYGLKAWTYLFGDSQISDISYKILFCLFVVVGAAATLGSVTDFSDAMIFAMVFPNVIGLVILAPVVREELDKYLGKIKSGEIVQVK